MNLNNLLNYDLIVIWGAGNGLKSYKKDFYCDYIVDKDENKIGKKYAGIEVKSIGHLYKNLDSLNDNAKALIVISATYFYDSIVDECIKFKNKVDYIKLNDLLAMYSCKSSSYALYGIDILVRDILIRANIKIEDMEYIEIGACDPIHGNKTFNLYLNGASGTLVEPNPYYSKEIKRIRNDEIIQKGIASRSGLLKYYKFENQFRNTFNSDAKDDYIMQGFRFLGEEDIECYIIENLFEESNVTTTNTVLFIQVMGDEVNVLNHVDLNKYGFPMIVIGYRNCQILSNACFGEYYQIAKIPGHVIFVNRYIYNMIGNVNGKDNDSSSASR